MRKISPPTGFDPQTVLPVAIATRSQNFRHDTVKQAVALKHVGLFQSLLQGTLNGPVTLQEWSGEINLLLVGAECAVIAVFLTSRVQQRRASKLQTC
jgi:hypothetical protein